MYWTSWGARVAETMKRHIGWENWTVERTEKSYLELFEKEKDSLVYLTADTDNVLTELNPNHIYIIGGLVDKNRHKGICAKQANQQGLKTARLPIEEYLQLGSRKVITVNQVFEILLSYAVNRNWEHSLDASMPQRKRQKTTENSPQIEGTTADEAKLYQSEEKSRDGENEHHGEKDRSEEQ